MPFDGIVMKAVIHELNTTILGGKIEKVFQCSNDELILHIYNKGKIFKLLVSANGSHARINLTQSDTQNTTLANFCLLLRKHLIGGKILELFQPGLERILEIKIENKNELREKVQFILIAEIMGKHSNIILLNQNRKIITCMKYIDFNISRLREILPGRDYVYPKTQEKHDPLNVTFDKVIEIISSISDIKELEKKLVNNFTGLSTFIAREIVYNTITKTNSNENDEISFEEKVYISAKSFLEVFQKVKTNQFQPYIIYATDNIPIDYHVIRSKLYLNYEIVDFQSINEVIDNFYYQKNKIEHFNNSKTKLIKIISQHLNKCNQKISILQERLQEAANAEKYKLYGELLTVNLYRIKEGISEVIVDNYYNNEKILIKLDPNISPAQNAQNFFKKYSKAKATYEATTTQLQTLLNEQAYLENILYQLEISETEDDLLEIKNELISQGIINEHPGPKKSKQITKSSNPYQFISSDGFEILVGKNNQQNDKLSLKIANNTDIWLHTKNIPGSHVIIRTEKKEVPEKTLFEAANIAAYFSKARFSSNVPVDYTTVKNIKKPRNAKPGFVVYENYKTIIVTPQKELIDKLKSANTLHSPPNN